MSTIEDQTWDVIVLSHKCTLPRPKTHSQETVNQCRECGQHWEKKEEREYFGQELHHWKAISERRVNKLKKYRLRTVGYQHVD